MGWSRRDEEFRADHDRDLRKHDTLPSRLSPPIATALEIAVLVKGLKNIRDCESLIEQYAQTVAAGARLEGVVQGQESTLAAFEKHAAGVSS